MQLVIIAGGFGTRLRPLTLERPKALVPLMNRPQILHILDRLPDSIDEVLVAVNYRFEQVRDFIKACDIGRTVTVVHERVPLGTGGALRNLSDRIAGTFAAFNGDVVDSLDVASLLRFHRDHGQVGTIAVVTVDDPTGYGIVAVDGDRATQFVEKPARDDAPSDLANAGRYVFEPEVLEFIEAGRTVSLERDVFPRLVEEGLAVYRHDGDWSDAGTRESYLNAQALLLRSQGGGIAEDAEVARARLLRPVLVGAGAFVEGRVGPHVVLGKGCRIGRAAIEDSALFDGVSVDDKAEIAASILGAGASVGEGAVVRESIVGDRVHVAPRSKVANVSVAA